MSLLDSIYAPPRAMKPWSLEDLLAPASVRFYGLGRAALTDGLRAAGLRRGDPVLFPGLVCREAVDAARALRCEPRFLEVGPGLAPALPPSEWPQARAVVAVDYFGFAQDLEPFRRYAQRAGSFLFEDNAHGLFSRGPDGAWLGLRADAGVFSPRKTIPLPNGGLLAIPAGSRLEPPQSGAFQGGESSSFLVKQLLRASVGTLGRRPVRALQRLSRAFRRRDGAVIPERAVVPFASLAGPLAAADPQAEVERRRALYAWAEERVRPLGGRPVFPSLPEGVAPYVFPFRAASEAAAAVRRALDEDGVDVYPWPELPEEVAPSAPPHYRDILCVRFLW